MALGRLRDGSFLGGGHHRPAAGGGRCPAIGVAVELGVADQLGRASRTADDLAAACGVHADSLRRLLDLLVHVRLVRRDRQGRYRLTRTGSRLRRDHPQSLSGWAGFFGGELHSRLWSEAGHSFRTGEAAPTASAAGGFFPSFTTV
ncbi:MAG: hypothetical protein WKF43_15850 [Acidimicrobiales bacterium]